ncbi:MAG: FtsX-like permease family protein [Bacteroidales bacterium]|nr:FtsX-like permease family protein [Bacteroidales bacterium]
MKSYLRFLSRNKLYTAIEVVGLSIALTFVILLSSYIIDSISYDKDIDDKEDIFVCHFINKASSFNILGNSFEKCPEVEDYCQFTELYLHLSADGNAFEDDVLAVSSNFFEFLPYKLTYGNASDVLANNHFAVVSESFADRMFPGDRPIGKQVVCCMEDSNVTLTITGVFEDVEKTQILNTDIVINQNFYDYQKDALFPCGNLLHISDDADLTELAESIYNGCDAFMFTEKLAPKLTFTKLNELDVNIGDPAPFENLYDRALQKTFTLFCVILLVFAILNYIFLTLAFSRFRIKEFSIRMLLGTDKVRTSIKIIAESLVLTSVAFGLGIILAISLEGSASELLRCEIDVFSNAVEVVWAIIIIIVTSLLSGIIPAFSSTLVDPINAVKGETRRTDKEFFAKAFIGIQGGICIIIISIAIAMFFQTRKMIDAPLGYDTERVLTLQGCDGLDIENHLANLPCVKAIGKIGRSPVQLSSGSTQARIGNDMIKLNRLDCSISALEVLGIEIAEQFNSEINVWDKFITESGYQSIMKSYEVQGIDPEDIKTVCSGVVKDFRFGNITTVTDGVNCITIMPADWIPLNVIKCNTEEHQAIAEISDRLKEVSINDFEISSMRDQLQETFIKEKNSIVMISTFAVLCVLLTIMAIVAISSYYSQMKTHDTAINKVFGASQKKVFWDMVWNFTVPILIASVIAIPVAYLYIDKWLQSYPVRIENTFWIYIGSLSLVLMIVVASITLQALRLMRTNPAEALKKE